MTKQERQFIRLLTGFFYGITIFLLVGLFFWFYPRQVVKSSTLMQTDKPEYSIGERIFVTGETWINIDTMATFNVRLICDEIKYPYDNINNLSVSRQLKPIPYNFPYEKIPEYIPRGSTCRIETTSSYPVEVLPFLTRNYQYVFNSNQFQIKE